MSSCFQSPPSVDYSSTHPFFDSTGTQSTSLVSTLDQCMLATIDGRAWLFVQRLSQFVEEFKLKLPEFDRNLVHMMPSNELFYIACKFFKCQEKFRQEGRPCQVAMGYHYTRSKHLDNIAGFGLKNRDERQKVGVHHHNGSAFGEGIYVAEEPRTWRRFGEVCILVAILPGTQMTDTDSERAYHKGNTSILAANGAALVLKKASQCLTLVHFNKDPLWKEVYNGFAKFRGLNSIYEPSSSRRGQAMEQFHAEFANFLEQELNSKVPGDPPLPDEILSVNNSHRESLSAPSDPVAKLQQLHTQFTQQRAHQMKQLTQQWQSQVAQLNANRGPPSAFFGSPPNASNATKNPQAFQFGSSSGH